MTITKHRDIKGGKDRGREREGRDRDGENSENL